MAGQGERQALAEARLADALERAVKFMHTANPVRVLEPEEVADTGPAEFGLDSPRVSIALEDARGAVLEADFGAPNADGLLQYMRLREGRRALSDVGF